jgi:ABC-type Fe3+-hydroxamate transport system substrate-binding protein
LIRGLVLAAALAGSLPAGIDGRPIAPQAHPRIVSVSPALTETLYAIGAGSFLVADSDYCNYPAAAKALPKVGAVVNLSVEKVVAFRPTLIVAATGSREQWKHLGAASRAPVYVAHTGGIPALLADIRALGRICRREEGARKLAGVISGRLERLRKATAGKPRPRVFYLVWHDPLMSAGRGSYLDDLITAAGGKNITGDFPEPYPRLSWETLLASPPEVVIGPAHLKTEVAAIARKVNARRTAILDEDIASRPGPRVVEALDLFHAPIRDVSVQKTRP